jgi:hypothetical protein
MIHVESSEARERTEALLQNAFQLGALIMTTGVFPIVARTGVDFDYIVVRQEDVRRMNLSVATPVDNAFR